MRTIFIIESNKSIAFLQMIVTVYIFLFIFSICLRDIATISIRFTIPLTHPFHFIIRGEYSVMHLLGRYNRASECRNRMVFGVFFNIICVCCSYGIQFLIGRFQKPRRRVCLDATGFMKHFSASFHARNAYTQFIVMEVKVIYFFEYFLFYSCCYCCYCLQCENV